MTTPIAPGSRVKLNAPIGKLQRGAVMGPARLVIQNGAEGTVIGAGGKESVIVGFDDLGGLSVGISVPIGWLRETPRERSADAELDRTGASSKRWRGSIRRARSRFATARQ